MCCCGSRQKKDSKGTYDPLTDMELRVRHSEVTEDLECAISEAVIYGCASGSILVAGACTGVLPAFVPGIVASSISATVATAKVCKLDERLGRINAALGKREKKS